MLYGCDRSQSNITFHSQNREQIAKITANSQRANKTSDDSLKEKPQNLAIKTNFVILQNCEY